jgi:hypothetical protein
MLGMDHFFQHMASYCGLTQNQYWHLHLLSSITFLPLLGVLYLVFSTKRKHPTPSMTGHSSVSLWVDSAGRLVALPTQQASSMWEANSK